MVVLIWVHILPAASAEVTAFWKTYEIVIHYSMIVIYQLTMILKCIDYYDDMYQLFSIQLNCTKRLTLLCVVYEAFMYYG